MDAGAGFEKEELSGDLGSLQAQALVLLVGESGTAVAESLEVVLVPVVLLVDPFSLLELLKLELVDFKLIIGEIGGGTCFPTARINEIETQK